MTIQWKVFNLERETHDYSHIDNRNDLEKSYKNIVTQSMDSLSVCVCVCLLSPHFSGTHVMLAVCGGRDICGVEEWRLRELLLKVEW